MADKNTPAVVIVACKIAFPWIDFEVCRETVIQENTQTGPRDVKQWYRTGRKVRIRGTAYPRGEAPEGFPERPQFVNGYALTHGVDGEAMEIIAKQHEKAPYFASGMIKIAARLEDVKAMTADYAKQLSGIEPIGREKVNGQDNIKDARMAGSLNANVTDVQPAIRAA